MQNAKEWLRWISAQIEQTYPAPEAKQMAKLLLECLNVPMCDIIAEKNIAIDKGVLEEWLKRIASHEPIQYILDEAHFYGYTFALQSSVLIPRPETEELVYYIIKEWNNQHSTPQILDIGTGSGCIAITLALEITPSDVLAWDISEKALEVAQQNATKLGAKNVTVARQDILSDPILPQRFDIIVSNPPYVVDWEKEQMRPNVLEFEPSLALFVPEHDPLLFYQHIAGFALIHLKPNGGLYLEINERYGHEMCELLEGCGFVNVLLHQDIHGKNRFVSARMRT